MITPVMEGKTCENEQIEWKQSANALFNFMPELRFLKMILNNRAIIPRYVSEYVNYLNINGLYKIIFPMTCFCDIPFSKINAHLKNYGPYGIGLNKADWGVQKGLQPIKYINTHSQLIKDFKESFKAARSSKKTDEGKILRNYIFSDLIFTKPIRGIMDTRQKPKADTLFQDECEWRYVPTFNENIDIPIVLIENEAQAVTHNLIYYNEVLRNHKEVWLNFELKDIRYIIVQNQEECDELINFIMNELEAPMKEKYLLITKITNMENLKGDI